MEIMKKEIVLLDDIDKNQYLFTMNYYKSDQKESLIYEEYKNSLLSNIFIKSVLFAIKCEFDKIEHNMNYYNLYKDFIISIRNNLLSFGNYIQHIIDINNDFQDFNKDIENNSIKLIIYIYIYNYIK